MTTQEYLQEYKQACSEIFEELKKTYDSNEKFIDTTQMLFDQGIVKEDTHEAAVIRSHVSNLVSANSKICHELRSMISHLKSMYTNTSDLRKKLNNDDNSDPNGDQKSEE